MPTSRISIFGNYLFNVSWYRQEVCNSFMSSNQTNNAMKTQMLTVLIALVVSTASAQINKGAVLVGVSSSLGYSSYSFKSSFGSTPPSSSLLNLNLRGGYFAISNLAIGLNVNVISSSQGSSSSTITAFGIFSRYYMGGKFFIGAGYNSASSSVTSGTFNSSTSYTTIPFEVGFAAFINDNIAIEPSITYTTTTNDNGGVSVFGIPSSAISAVGLNIGFTFYLNRNKE